MRKTATMTILAAFLIAPSLASAADKCPSELTQAKSMLGKATSTSTQKSATGTQAPRQLAGAKAQDIQAPRAQDIQAPRSQNIRAPRAQDIQAPRSQDIQAPRAQDIQAPRSQDAQAPRAQDIQAPRSQDVQAPRAQDIQAPRAQTPKASDTPQDIQVPRSAEDKARYDKARKLISDSEAACKKGDMKLSASKANKAMGLLK
jgi:hypothetical protein